MKCEVCRGACCESMFVGASDKYEHEWMAVFFGQGGKTSGKIEVPLACAQLAEGRCGIYENRPLVCRLYVAGGSDCLETVRLRRTAGQYALIRDESDPKEIHGT